jgi:hypothetical protein
MCSWYTLMLLAEARQADLLREAKPRYRSVSPKRNRLEPLSRRRPHSLVRLSPRLPAKPRDAVGEASISTQRRSR